MLSQGVWLGFYDWCALWNDSGLYDMVLYINWVGSVFCDTALCYLFLVTCELGAADISRACKRVT